MNKKWTAKETRLVEPYPRADRALRNIRFRIDPEGEFSDSPAYWLDPDDLPPRFAPEFSLSIDTEPILRASGLDPSDARIVCVVRDRMLRNWSHVKEWPVNNVDDRYLVSEDVLRRFGIPWRLEFAALLTPARQLPATQGRAHLPQHVIGEQSFRVGLQRDGARFPVDIRETAWFINAGYPADTVWTIDWVSSDVEATPSEALRVVVNEAYRAPVEKMLSSNQAPAVLAHQMAADIFTEVAYVVLERASETDVDPGSLTGIVLDALGIHDDAALDRLRGLLTEETTRLNSLRAHAQSIVGLAHILEKV